MDAGIHGTQTPCLLVQLTDGQANWFTDVQLININWRLTTDVYLQVATNYFLFSSWLYSGVDFNNKVTIIRAGDKWSTKIHCTCSDLGFTAAKCWQDYFPAFFGFLFVWFFFFSPGNVQILCFETHFGYFNLCIPSSPNKDCIIFCLQVPLRGWGQRNRKGKWNLFEFQNINFLLVNNSQFISRPMHWWKYRVKEKGVLHSIVIFAL